MSRPKLWAFRIGAAIGVPLLLFVVLELGLRVVGFGYPTNFFLESERDGKPVLIENDQFGWRFFGPRLARMPSVMSIDIEKPPDTVRICVFGESAAFGDPQPDYGLPRMLNAMLSLRYPGVRFEVINAAMTGINSHTVREIAKDCVATHSDIWVVYMGNNEVVGPFGAGTVFGTKTPPLPLIRANLAFKTTRAGQLLERILPSAAGGTTGSGEWGGMEMFVNNQVRQDDPRMETVYHHFRQNLEEIVELARGNKVGVIVSTVAVNFRDCAPFASASSTRLPAAQKADWESIYLEALKLQQAGNDAAACEQFEKAANIDGTAADLQFRWGQSLLKMGNVAAARKHFVLARDEDELRFRCDSRLDEITRDVASGREAEQIRFVDAAERFQELSSPQISGNEFFYEHVHLTFDGNYQLARLLAEQFVPLLPKEIASKATAGDDWPTRDQCADRLAWSRWSLRSVLADLLVRLDDPPFTSQLNHAEQLQQVVRELARLDDVNQPAGLKAAAEQCRRAVQAAPDDPVLLSQLALLLGQTGDLDGAYQAALKSSQLLPHSAGKLFQLGISLAVQHRDEEAVAVFNHGLTLQANNVWMRQELSKTLIRLNRKDEALAQLKRTIEISPQFGPAYLTAGMLLEEKGHSKEAETYYRQALEHPIHRPADMAALGQMCQRKGWFAEAEKCYSETLRLSPFDPTVHLAIAQCLDALKRPAEAEAHYARLVELAPQSAQARYAWGVHYAKQGDDAQAAQQFLAAAELKPEFLNARVDYAMALIALGRQREALNQFKLVLARDPKHKTALQYKEAIEKELSERKQL